MLQVAVEIDDYRQEMMDNIVRAEAKYVGNVYYITNKTRITVSGKVFFDNGDYVIKDAELVSIG